MSTQPITSGAAAVPVWRLSWGLIILVMAVALVSLWPFWDGLERLWSAWVDTPEYSHGLLIPPIAAFLVWQQKDRLERLPFGGSWWGVLIVLTGAAVLALGQLGTVFTLVQYAYVITLFGLALALLGWRAFRLVAIPLLIVMFMIPLPQFVLANLSTKLQLLSSQIGVSLIRLFGISVFLEGNVIDLGGYKLQVADACSGLRYLFPLMTMGFLMAYFYKGALWKRILLFLSSIPITVLMNSFRIGIIGITVDRWGTVMAEGFLHEFQGWMVFMVSIVLMVGEIMVLNRISPERAPWRALFGIDFPAPTPVGLPERSRRLPPPFIAACILMAAIITLSVVMPRPQEIIPQRTAFAEFPRQLGPWSGHPQSLEGIYSDALQLDDYLLSDYAGPDGTVLNLYIAWYNSQRKGEAVHSPRSCLPGGGWQLTEFGQRELPGVMIDGRTLRVNRAVTELGNARELVYYWFQQRGRVIDNEFAVKWFLFWDALTRHRTDGALVRLIVPLAPTTDIGTADRQLAEFASRLAPGLTRYIPE